MKRVWLHNVVGLSLGCAAIIIAAGAAYNAAENDDAPRFEVVGEYHRLSIPVVDPNRAQGCDAELAAYGVAVVTLRAAQKAADDAYAAWYACEHNGQPPPTPPAPVTPDDDVEPLFSILER